MEDSQKKILIVDKLDEDVIGRLQQKHGESNVILATHNDIEPKSAEKSRRTAKDIEKHMPDIVYIRSTDLRDKLNGDPEGEDLPETTAALNKLAEAEKKTVFIRGGAGTANLNQAKEMGFPVANTPGANANAVADLLAGMMGQLIAGDKLEKITVPSGGPTDTLEVLKNIIIEREILDGERTKNKKETINAKTLKILEENKLPEFEGRKILIRGVTGYTGQAMAKIAKAMGMEVMAVKERSVDEEYASENGITLVEGEDPKKGFKEAVKQADVVSLHVDLIKGETDGMMTQELFDIMEKRDSILLNAARAGLIAKDVLTKTPIAIDDQQSTIDALNLKSDNLLVTPKRGAKTIEASEAVGKMAEEQMNLVMEEGKVKNHVMPYFDVGEVVNLQEIEMPKTKGIE